MKLKATWTVSGQGDLDIHLSDIEDLTPDGVRSWLIEGAQLEIIEQGNYFVDVRLNCTDEDLEMAIAELKAEQAKADESDR